LKHPIKTHATTKKTNATKKYYLLQHQNKGCYNIKFIQLQHESVAFMKSASEEEGYSHVNTNSHLNISKSTIAT
jgi:hypothetical protein